ncbi:MAG: sulfatase [Myxococcales bacterium]|nr:sulfatase [Myxococcales bacterium]
MGKRLSRARVVDCVLAVVALALPQTGEGAEAASKAFSRPNVLWIVWDTVRADRLGLYGHDAPTTPNLERWARKARVYDCLSVGGWTPPSHASMFTGLFPSEHGVNGLFSKLPDGLETVAERYRSAGYQTYLYSANPLVSASTGLARGFATVEHPFDEALRERAATLVKPKLSGGGEQAVDQVGAQWAVGASGQLGNERFLSFVDARDSGRPFLAFLNYVEAHRPRIPSRRMRERFLSPADVAHSYRFDQRQERFQAVSLGLGEPFSERERRIIRGLYDASIAELDELLGQLLTALEMRGLLGDLVIVLVSDHGEQLGDHGSYLHQYSLYEPIVRVPLVIWWAGRLPSGREAHPVSSIDLHATLLELAGLPATGHHDTASLLAASRPRLLFAQYVSPYALTLAKFERKFPDWNSAPFRRRLSAVQRGPLKLLHGESNGSVLYDLKTDPGELEDAGVLLPEAKRDLSVELYAFGSRKGTVHTGNKRQLDDSERQRLETLGYVVD